MLRRVAPLVLLVLLASCGSPHLVFDKHASDDTWQPPADSLCRAGNQYACAQEGRAKRQAEGAARDLVGGSKLLSSACDAGESAGCLWLGSDLANPNSPDGDLDKAVILLQRACELARDQERCEYHGRDLMRTPGPRRDHGLVLLQSACAAGRASACPQ